MAPSPHEIDFATAKATDLHEILRQLRETGAVVPATLHGKPAWIITRHAELRAAFKDEAHFQSAKIQASLIGPTMQSMTGQEHRRNRDLVSFAFIPAAIAQLADALIEPLAHELLDELQGEREFDLISRFTRRSPAC
jgi:cytochrome P450